MKTNFRNKNDILKKFLASFSFTILFFLFTGCYHKTEIPKKDIFSLENIHLNDEIYYFSAKKEYNSNTEYQPLKRFDLIFVGHNPKISPEKFKNLSALIPGKYTHVLMYIGKDKNGFAYAVEMNADKNRSFKIDKNGIKIGGRLYFYCLGNDFNKKVCPSENYPYGLKSYDFMWAKRVKTDLRRYESKLLEFIKNDYENRLPFQLPLMISLKTKENKNIILIDDGRKNGASCAEYFASLFEDTLDICINNIRIDAKDLKNYYTINPTGQKAYIPIHYNIFFDKKIYLKELFTTLGYNLKNDRYKKNRCGKRKGIVTPDLLFKQLADIDILKNR